MGGQTKLTIFATVDGSVIHLCLQLDARNSARRAGSSATGDACLRVRIYGI